MLSNPLHSFNSLILFGCQFREAKAQKYNIMVNILNQSDEFK